MFSKAIEAALAKGDKVVEVWLVPAAHNYVQGKIVCDRSNNHCLVMPIDLRINLCQAMLAEYNQAPDHGIQIQMPKEAYNTANSFVNRVLLSDTDGKFHPETRVNFINFDNKTKLRYKVPGTRGEILFRGQRKG